MVFQIKFLLPVVLVLVPGISLQTNLTCFRSSNPVAVGAKQLFGSLSDKLLWIRDPDTTDPLPPCSSSFLSPPSSLCDVCRLEEDVYMICDNLPDGETLNLEDPPESLMSEQSDCPTLPPADNQELHHLLVIGCPIIGFIIFGIIGVILYKRFKG